LERYLGHHAVTTTNPLSPGLAFDSTFSSYFGDDPELESLFTSSQQFGIPALHQEPTAPALDLSGQGLVSRGATNMATSSAVKADESNSGARYVAIDLSTRRDVY
jgi:hypothetical protein